MKKPVIRQMFAAILVALLMVLVAVQPAAAQETEVEIVGTVTAIDEAAGSFTVETEAGETYTVVPGEGFDFSTLAVGDTVAVEGTLNEDETISALNITVEGQEEEPEDTSAGYYCTQAEDQHPFGARLAERYETDYETLQEWFCDGFGWGQIMLALQTSEITEGDPAALLEARRGGQGWGQIWQELKLVGRPEHAGPPNDEDGNGRPDFAGPPNDEDGNGRPDFAGPPDHAGPPNEENGKGRPEGAGPPAGRP
jgi:hypothetical protein